MRFGATPNSTRNFHVSMTTTYICKFLVKQNLSPMLLFSLIIHQIFSLARNWPKRITWLRMSQLKLWNIPVIFPNLQNCACCQKDWTLSVNQSSHFSSNYALGKLFASCNRWCPRTNIRTYFRAKWRLFSIYFRIFLALFCWNFLMFFGFWKIKKPKMAVV